MRLLFKNDIVRLAKDIKDVKMWSVYFLLHKEQIVYVGYSETPYVRICTHIKKFNVDQYHILNFATKDEAIEMEKTYIRSFKPLHNISENDQAILERKQLKENNISVEIRTAAIDACITNLKINITNNSYIKKANTYYIRLNGDNIFELKIKVPFFYLKGRKYKYPDKLIGNINDLLIPQD